ncbi:MAG: hypothetical protein CL908_08300 [Deltaproteobacteria bacterium]|nr:hypothetical protein [Deltaproteobacteria bacterium]
MTDYPFWRIPDSARSTIGPTIFGDGVPPRKKSVTEIGPTTRSAARSRSTSGEISPRSRARSKMRTKGSRRLRVAGSSSFDSSGLWARSPARLGKRPPSEVELKACR